MQDLDKATLELLIRKVITEQLGRDEVAPTNRTVDPSGIIALNLPTIKVTEENRLDTGKAGDVVYTKDLFSLEESPRLGTGIMEMKDTTFDWTLDYDEVDYIIEGQLDIIIDGRKISAKQGEVILIPKGSKIQFSVTGHARFLYVTFPADWANQ
jgi:ethanolamine utilization protein EutQ